MAIRAKKPAKTFSACYEVFFSFFSLLNYFLDDLIEKAYSVFHLRLNINMYVCMYEIVVRRYLYIGSPHLQK